MSKKIEVRTSEKYVLSVEETAVLFSIGVNKIYSLIDQNPRADWMLRVGNWTRIKKDRFAAMIDSTDAI